ncbi:FadR/GntR family transcriptional regulator [Novosphingobium taihuense]|uniref:DNA-binding FadR family transcriptional regulator n=1 Tax=Novosphingobium taihuense TaxID=260085 RepID=A0A7W7AFR1_9SPHN|nr:GntR family transcriptional regulator [Novosphingobium taihuense]MBB4615420.1 DNA-binding FadR family transcriptional regulator [Novosphingobium taihuense]TWH82132.1 DNA-binding FadR family transcriptional regulator [Novosphingobium taihuense]
MAAVSLPLAGAKRRRRKLGEIVAERIVADIVRRGWPEGEMLGTEADFMDRYRVSRATFREAMRQIEGLGAAAMRRGAGGGLVVKAPPRDGIVASLRTWLSMAQVSSNALVDVAEVLRRAQRVDLHAAPNQAIALFLAAVEPAGGNKQEPARKLSECVAQRIIKDIDTAGAAPGINLGSEDELRIKYGVSRAVLREALRSLELHDLVRVKTGARGGVLVHAIDPGYTIEIASTWLHYARLPVTHLWEAHSCLAEAAFNRFASHASQADIADLERAFTRLADASASHYLVAANAFHEIIAERCGNSAIALFVRILLKFGPEVVPQPDPAFLPRIKNAHALLLAEIKGGRPETATATFYELFQHARRWLEGIERQQGRR